MKKHNVKLKNIFNLTSLLTSKITDPNNKDASAILSPLKKTIVNPKIKN